MLIESDYNSSAQSSDPGEIAAQIPSKPPIQARQEQSKLKFAS